MLNSGLKKGITIGVGTVVGLTLIFSSYSSVESGQIGLRKTMGKLSETPLNDGPHLKIPFIQEIVKVDTKTQNVMASGAAASKDMQNVTSKISVNYHVDKVAAYGLLTKVGANYESTVIAPRIQETLKAVTAKYVASDLIAKRDEVSQEMTDILTKKLAAYDLAVLDVNIIDFNFSEAFNEAIEAKQTAQQSALKAQNDLERIKIEAEQQVVQAKAEADSLNEKRAAVTPELLELERIQVQQTYAEAEKAKAEAIKETKVSTLVLNGGMTPTLPIK